MAKQSSIAPAIVIFGDEPYQKSAALRRWLDLLLPPTVDRSMALMEYDGTAKEEQGGPTAVAVIEDLRTLPFLADRRIVAIRDADAFISATREIFERYFANPSKFGTLILECRSFPKTTRLYKAMAAAGGEMVECKKLRGRALTDFVLADARRLGKRLDSALADRIVNLVGENQGALSCEMEKLTTYIGDRPAITDADITELVGLSREEKIFAAMDAAAMGRMSQALAMWQQALSTDTKAEFKVVGGVAWCLRRWLSAHTLAAQGMPIGAIAPKVSMWNRESELSAIMRRLSPQFLRRQLAQLAELDAQAKVGARSIESGVEVLLVRLAQSA